MAIGKLLRLGGMDNSNPKTDQPIGRFRVARNVLPSLDNCIVPRNGQVTKSNLFPADTAYVHYMSQHNKENLAVLSRDAVPGYGPVYLEMYKYEDADLTATRIPTQGYCMGVTPLFFQGTNDSHRSVMSHMRNNTTYFINPTSPNTEKNQQIKRALFKYDGVEVMPMGSPQPRISSPNKLDNGTKYIRVVQHLLDFDNNEPVSEYVQFRTSAATTLNIVTNPSQNMITVGGTTPATVIGNGYGGDAFFDLTDTLYFIGTAAYDGANNEFDITASETNISLPSHVGAYVFTSCWTRFGGTGVGFSGLNEDALAIAFKIKSVSPLTLDANDIKILNGNKEWVEGTIAIGSEVAATITYGTRKFLSVWASGAAEGDYFIRDVIPAFPESQTDSFSFPVNVSSVTTAISIPAGYPGFIGAIYQCAFTAPPILRDWYDTTSKKISPNADYPFTDKLGMTLYQDLMIMFTEDLIWFSDPTLGGTFEQLSASAFIRVGDTEDGKIVTACGNQDFLFVSRERRNYYVIGNLVTGNYKVQDVTEAEIGAYCNNGSIAIKGNIFFITCKGVYKVGTGGACQNISERIPQNFKLFDNYQDVTNSDVVFKINSTLVETASFGSGLSIKFDEYRDLLVFCEKGNTDLQNSALVLNTVTNEFYEWINFQTGSGFSSLRTSCIYFKNGLLTSCNYSLDQTVDGFGMPIINWTSSVNSENSTLSVPYSSTTYPVKLYSTWMTAGEPSLEKQALQLKIFGILYPNVPVNVVHFKDWDYLTKITNIVFSPPQNLANPLYFHKQRLNSDKVFAISTGIEVTGIALFKIEGMEIEFNPIQSGMKR